MSSVTCGGFFIYGTPCIFIQEIEKNSESQFFGASCTPGIKVEGATGINPGSGQMPGKGALGNSSISGIGKDISQIDNISNHNDGLNLDFSYLHNNISKDVLGESMFKFMPILKNFTEKNLLPIVDFEEIQHSQLALSSGSASGIEASDIKYLVINVTDSIPEITKPDYTTVLMKVPDNLTDEISFFKFPDSNYMEIECMKHLLGCEMKTDDPSKMFSKKFFSKNGWDFISISQRLPNSREGSNLNS